MQLIIKILKPEVLPDRSQLYVSLESKWIEKTVTMCIFGNTEISYTS